MRKACGKMNVVGDEKNISESAGIAEGNLLTAF